MARCLQLHVSSFGTARKPVPPGPDLAHFLRVREGAAERPLPVTVGEADEPPSISPRCVASDSGENDAAPPRDAHLAGTFHIETCAPALLFQRA